MARRTYLCICDSGDFVYVFTDGHRDVGFMEMWSLLEVFYGLAVIREQLAARGGS